MNTHIKKTLSLILAVMMLFGTFAFGASADEVKRISCTMVENGENARGFSWYTYENGKLSYRLEKLDLHAMVVIDY